MPGAGASGKTDAVAAEAAAAGAPILSRPEEQVAQAPSAHPSPLKLTRPRTTSPLDSLSESADDDEVGEEGAPNPLPRDKPLLDRSARSTGQSPSVADRIASYRPGCTTGGSCVRGGSGEVVLLPCARCRRLPRIIALIGAGAGDAGGSGSGMPPAPGTPHPRLAPAASTAPASAVADAIGVPSSSASPRRHRDSRHRDGAFEASIVSGSEWAMPPVTDKMLFSYPRLPRQLNGPSLSGSPCKTKRFSKSPPGDARRGEGRGGRLPHGEKQPPPSRHAPADNRLSPSR